MTHKEFIQKNDELLDKFPYDEMDYKDKPSTHVRAYLWLLIGILTATHAKLYDLKDFIFPEITPCSNGTIDLVWYKDDSNRILLNIKKEDNPIRVGCYGETTAYGGYSIKFQVSKEESTIFDYIPLINLIQKMK